MVMKKKGATEKAEKPEKKKKGKGGETTEASVEVIPSGRGTNTAAVYAAMTKKYGGGVAFVGDSGYLNINMIRSGVPEFDLDVGGIPEGRVTEIFGPEGSGKTTLMVMAIASVQKKYPGEPVGFIDFEHALDLGYVAALGVDVNNLLVVKPDNGEQGLAIAEDLIDTGVVKAIVIDSVSAIMPKAELEGEMGYSRMGQQAKLLSTSLRRLIAKIAKNKVTSMWINQQRMKIGQTHGSPITTSGGEALKFYASLRIQCFKADFIKNGEDIIGQLIKMRILKNKARPPHKFVEMRVIFGKGFDRFGSLLKLGVQHGWVTKAGSWYSMTASETKIGQGELTAIEFLRENPEHSQVIQDNVDILEKELYGKKETLNEVEFVVPEAKEIIQDVKAKQDKRKPDVDVDVDSVDFDTTSVDIGDLQ